MEFFRETHIDFLKWRKTAIMGSSLFILIGIFSLIFKGGPAYNIDFLGGNEVEFRFQKSERVDEIRHTLATLNFATAEIKSLGGEREFIVRIPQQEGDQEVAKHIMTALDQSFPQDKPELMANTSIGPKIGKELRNAAIWSILISLGLILIYVSMRFEFIFAVGAVIALFHDVLITLGLFSLFNLEVSLSIVAAFLTLIGYSLNDTIVVFDRVRENMKKLRRHEPSIAKIINLSINQTLSRTILTSGTTLIVVVVLFVFGGEVLHNFSFCLLVGILVGTYSSVYIAAPVVVEWYERHEHTKAVNRPRLAKF